MPIDENAITEYLNNGGFIARNDEISLEFSLRLAKYPMPQLRSLFVFYEKNYHDIPQYIVNCRCHRCYTEEQHSFSKTKLLDHFKLLQEDFKRRHTEPHEEDGLEYWLCEECCRYKKIITEQKNQQVSIEQERIRQRNIIGVLSEIDDFWLNPQEKSETNNKIFSELVRTSYYIKDDLAYKVKSIGYRTYLKTPLWKLIAWKVKSDANFQCKLCASTKNLNAHHSSYKRIGYEIFYWKEDLICICHNCHSHHHHVKK